MAVLTDCTAGHFASYPHRLINNPSRAIYLTRHWPSMPIVHLREHSIKMFPPPSNMTDLSPESLHSQSLLPPHERTSIAPVGFQTLPRETRMPQTLSAWGDISTVSNYVASGLDYGINFISLTTAIPY